MENINKLKKALWKKVYGAYRAHNKAKQAYSIAYDAWIQSDWDDKYLPTLHKLNSRINANHAQWLDTLSLIREYNKDIANGLKLDVLCQYAIDKTPQQLMGELLHVRLINYRSAINDLWFDATGGYSNPIYDI